MFSVDIFTLSNQCPLLLLKSTKKHTDAYTLTSPHQVPTFHETSSETSVLNQQLVRLLITFLLFTKPPQNVQLPRDQNCTGTADAELPNIFLY